MRIARSTGAFSGLLIEVLGIWGALIPFVGPYFDYAFGVNSSWHYTTDRLLLCILPGAAALAGGLLLIRAASRAGGAFGGWLAVLAGAWFAVGPAFSRIWEHAGTSPIGAPLFGSTRQALELVGYFYGLGALIIALAAFAVGRFASRPAIVAETAAAPAAGGYATPAPAVAAAPSQPIPTTPAVTPPATAEPVSTSGAHRGRRRWRSHAVSAATATRRQGSSSRAPSPPQEPTATARSDAGAPPPSSD
jgi:hypothetical protein